MTSAAQPLLDVRNLSVVYHTGAGPARAVDNVSFFVARSETVAIVGESGSGKSNALLAVMRLIQAPGAISGGQISFDGRDLLTLSEQEMRALRGNRLSMVFQDPMTALNPLFTIGRQVSDILRQHLGLDKHQARERATELLQRVGISDAERRLRDYPHLLSGGLRQRVMIAMALACEPELLIADEPTTALDVTIQAQIIELVKTLQSELNTAVVWITHDLGVVANLADRVLVMYAGQIVESAPVERLYRSPAHPYTAGLLASLPRLDAGGKERLQSIEGAPPNALLAIPGCPFAARCQFALEQCHREKPPPVAVAVGHHSACWLASADTAHPWQRPVSP